MIAKKPYIFVIFQECGGPDLLSPTLDPHMKFYLSTEILHFIRVCSEQY